jgi:GH25 family lysozyme M1 (1,4-beta-N-acetylmuramidase)
MEANTVANALATAHARLSLPIFYDLEDWATASGNAPVDPIFWKARTQEFYAQLKNRGYDENKIFCYSYPSWFDKICGEDDYLKEHLAWRASYNSVFNGDGTTYPDFNWDNFPPNKIHAWQYTSEGVFPGIYSSTTVDISAIYNYSF